MEEGKPQERARLLGSKASSATRVLRDRSALADVVADSATREGLKQVVKPNSVSRTLRKAGVALIMAPDPVTAVPGALMLGASLAARGKEPLKPSSVYEEVKGILDEMGSII